MSFTSWDFFSFFVALTIIFSLSKDRNKQGIMLVGSYLFYSWWNWLYLPILLCSTAVDFILARRIHTEKNQSRRKALLLTSILFNTTLLAYFKYHNFLVENINFAFNKDFKLHDLMLPIGISFYTFQTMSYSIDIYRSKIEPQRNFIEFALFVSFFPQLIAGPIERGKNLLPQIATLSNAKLHQVKKGLLLITWGLLIKLVIANNLTAVIDEIFFSNQIFDFKIYILGSVLFLIKIYTDFMAYSEIARGVALFFGVQLSINFRRPFFALSLREFWTRWHITLTKWIGDYVNTPLNRKIKSSYLRKLTVVLVMTLVGIWHGASWNFILYGFLQGTIIWLWNPVSQFFQNHIPLGNYTKGVLGWFFMMVSVIAASPMFLISDWNTLQTVLRNIYTLNAGTINISLSIELIYAGVASILLLCVSLNDELTSKSTYSKIMSLNMTKYWLTITLLAIIVLIAGNFDGEEFIYFAF